MITDKYFFNQNLRRKKKKKKMAMDIKKLGSILA